MEALLTTHNLTKDYSFGQVETVHVLKGIDLTINKGDYVAVMGPSGSGKTTLLNCLSGLDTPTTGTVTLAGCDLSTFSESRRTAMRLHQIGFVFQQPTFLATLNLLDNIILPGYLSGSPRPIAAARGRDLMVTMGISDLADRNTAQVSGGQLQRAAICRALINDPTVIFGDEPTGALNQTAARDVLHILDHINADGTTLILVTHDPRVAAHTRRVLVLTDGSFIAEQDLGPCFNLTDLPRREERLARWLLDIGV